jgi:hypothetical protein
MRKQFTSWMETVAQEMKTYFPYRNLGFNALENLQHIMKEPLSMQGC